MNITDIWLTYAYICDSKVQNIASYLYTGYTQADLGAKAFCNNDNAFAVDVTYTPVQIGDDYINGEFYRDGEKINSFPSATEVVNSHTNELASHDSDIDELWVAILEG